MGLCYPAVLFSLFSLGYPQLLISTMPMNLFSDLVSLIKRGWFPLVLFIFFNRQLSLFPLHPCSNFPIHRTLQQQPSLNYYHAPVTKTPLPPTCIQSTSCENPRLPRRLLPSKSSVPRCKPSPETDISKPFTTAAPLLKILPPHRLAILLHP